MKVWKFYLEMPTSLYDNKFHLLISNHFDFKTTKRGTKTGLYAWTDSKEIKNGFLKTRNKDVFTVEKEDIDKYELEDLKNTHHKQYISFREFTTYDENNKKTKMMILCTLDEYISSTLDNDGRENMEWLPKMTYESKIPYKHFNEKLTRALAFIGLIDDYIRSNGMSETDSEQLDYNQSYGLSRYGGTNIVQKSLKNYFDEFRVLLLLFEYTFKI